MKFLKDFRFVANKIDPSKFTKIISKADIIIVSSYRSRYRTPHI
jgi:hypothetical protein